MTADNCCELDGHLFANEAKIHSDTHNVFVTICEVDELLNSRKCPFSLVLIVLGFSGVATAFWGKVLTFFSPLLCLSWGYSSYC